jgi:serine/threonine protein kinase
MNDSIIIGNGTTSIVVINDDKTVTKKFKKQKDYVKEKDILNYINENNQNLYRTITMLNFDDSSKSIDFSFIPNNLEECIGKTNKKISNKVTNKIIIDTVLILLKLHELKITHGDFKAKNIQLDEEFRPIIIDYGLSNYYYTLSEECLKNMRDDVDKLWFLIIQLLLNIEYKKSYTKINTNINEIKKQHPRLIEIYNTSKYDIEFIKDYFITI